MSETKIEPREFKVLSETLDRILRGDPRLKLPSGSAIHAPAVGDVLVLREVLNGSPDGFGYTGRSLEVQVHAVKRTPSGFELEFGA